MAALLGAVLVAARPPAAIGQGATIPAFSHVFVVVEENAESSRVLGNSARYVNQLIPQYSLATQYYAVSHPSLPNYLALAAGDTFGITSDCMDCFLDQPSLADEIEASGRRWRAYEESMPQPCFIGSAGLYTQTHNPFIYFNAIRTNPDRCAASIVPFTQFGADLAQHTLADFSLIVPNLCNDGHDCGWDVEDRWLAQLVPQLVGSPEFQDNGVLFITWDEGSSKESCCGGLAQGGQVVLLVASPLSAPSGFKSDVPASHYSVVRTIEDAWGLEPLGHTAATSAMADFFPPGSN